jgi:hypothetical protein
LKDIGTPMIRPSNSGSATFIAVSSGPRPRALPAHCAWLTEAGIAWRIGAPNCSSAATDQPAGVGPAGLTPPMAKLIVLITTSTSGRPSGPVSSFSAAGSRSAGAAPPSGASSLSE